MKQEICPNCGGSLKSEAIGWRCKKCKGFISMQDGKFYEYVEKPFMPPMTNADRIRAMSDDELAEWMYNGISTDPCDYCEYNNGYCDGSPCRGKADAETIIEWLRQPAEMKKDK